MPEFVCSRLDLLLGLQNPPPIPKSILGGHFIERNLNIVAGQPSSYKTIFMLEACSAIALGRPAFGLYPVEQGRVAFITGDDPPEVVIDRLLMLNADVIGDKRTINPEIRRRLAENIDVRALDQVVSLRNKDVFRFVYDVLDGVSFAVLDPLRHFIGQADENKAVEIYPELTPLRQLATVLPCAIAMVHHSKKETGESKLNDFSGSGAIRGLSRAMLNITRINPGVSPPRISVVGENRYGAEPPPLTLEIEHKPGGIIAFNRPEFSDHILNLITTAEVPLTTNGVIAAFDEPASAVRAALYRLRDKGLLASHKEGRQNVWRRTSRVSTASTAAPRARGGLRPQPTTAEEREHTKNL